MKRKFSMFLAVALMIMTMLPLNVFASNSNVGSVKTITTTYFDLNSLPEEAVQMYKSSGWIIDDDYSYRVSKPSKGELWIDGEVTSINNDGTFFVNPEKDFIDVALEKDGDSQRVYKSESGKFEVTQVVNLESLMDRMDMADAMQKRFKSANVSMLRAGHKGYYDKYNVGDWVHCNRFNGPATDDVHYPKTHWRAYVNFVQSDCDIALANSTKCWGWSYCNQSGPAGGCSIIIGRSSRYHRN